MSQTPEPQISTHDIDWERENLFAFPVAFDVLDATVLACLQRGHKAEGIKFGRTPSVTNSLTMYELLYEGMRELALTVRKLAENRSSITFEESQLVEPRAPTSEELVQIGQIVNEQERAKANAELMVWIVAERDALY